MAKVAWGVALAVLMALATIAAADTARAAPTEGFVTANDGTKLHYLETGTGSPVVLIPGWSQTAKEWKYQLDALGQHHHVFALDLRGHGKSDKPDYGYRIARLAADLHDFLVAKNLDGVVVDGHSMGCSVIWSYLEQYGPERLSKLVLTDQMPAIVANPAWTAQERKDYGSILNADQVMPLANALSGPEGEKTTVAFLHTMFAKDYPQPQFDWALAQNLEMPRAYAAELLIDHAFKDWRDVIRRIALPTLVIGAKASNVPWTSMVWVGQAIKGARTEIFEVGEGGSHFMFLENPTKYNAIVEDFVTHGS